MTRFNRIEPYNTIIKNIEQHKLFEAFNRLLQLTTYPGFEKFRFELENAQQSYELMIKYMTEGAKDPQRKEVLNQLILKLYDIVDRMETESIYKTSPLHYYSNYRFYNFQNKPLDNYIDEYKKLLDKINLFNDVQEDADVELDKNKTLMQCERLESEIFRSIWVLLPVSTSEIALITSMLTEDTYPLHFKELIISAILLSSLEHFNEKYLNILLDIYTTQNGILQIKALIAAVLIIQRYSSRVGMSSSVKNRFDLLLDNPQFAEDMKMVFLQLIRSRDTDKISKKMEDELLPELMKLSPEIYKKLKNDDASIDMESIEANPDWQEMLENSGISKKMQELNEMQMDGGDVFMGTFAHLKSFPFFNELSNWFLPFHENNSINRSAFKDSSKISHLITKAQFLCNSDKYSFALSLASVPEMQRNMMLSQFNSQSIDMKEMENAELLLPKKEREEKANKYIQDLYRFYKLYKYKNDFYSPFAAPFNFLEFPFIQSIITDISSLRLVGEFYFKHGYYEDAIQYFKRITQMGEVSVELFQKIGFCYQNISDIENAIDYFLKAELLNPQNSWTLKHLASCYRMINQIDKSLEYYQKALELNPENVNLILNVGHSLVEKGEPEEALKYYYKIDFLTTKSEKSWRPIAWCEFLLGNFEKSKSYYEKICATNPSNLDLLNMGHLELAMGNIKDAITLYIKSIKADNNSIVNFITNMEKDKIHLHKWNVTDDDIALVVDKIQYDLRN